MILFVLNIMKKKNCRLTKKKKKKKTKLCRPQQQLKQTKLERVKTFCPTLMGRTFIFKTALTVCRESKKVKIVANNSILFRSVAKNTR